MEIYYGSQLGNAQNVSQEIQHLISEHYKEKIELKMLNDFSFENIPKIIIFVCSTTGNGEFPENAVKFHKKIKQRSNPKDMFQGVTYAVLGLGDTNYSYFCETAKKIQKRCKELGGTPVFPMQYIDAMDDFDENIETFVNSIITSIESIR